MSRNVLGACLFAVFASAAALATFEASDPDLGFHLATGRAIRALGHLPDRNVLSFAEPNQTWVLQQGLPALWFELVWQWGGVAALILSKACVVALSFALVFLTATRLGAQPVIAGLTVICGAWSCAFRFVERPLIFSNLGLACVLWSLAAARGATGRARIRFLFVTALSVAIACNLHAGAVFAFILLFIVATALALEPLRARLPALGPVQAPAGLGPAAVVLGVAVAAAVLAAAVLALYHPFPLRVLEVPFVMGRDAFLAEHLIEFRPPTRFPFEQLQGYWLFLGAALFVILARLRSLPFSALSLVFAFALLSLRYVRFVDVFAMVTAPVLALALTDLKLHLRLRPWLGLTVLGALMIAAPIAHSERFPRTLRFAPQMWPTELFAFMAAEGLRGPAFVSDGWAGPHLAFFYPRERAYFFPAFDAFSPGLFHEYMDIRYGRPGWDTKLDGYGIELCLLKYTSQNERRYQAGAPNLRQLLANDGRWALVNFDDLGEIFVRRDGINRKVAERVGMTGIDPDRVTMTRVTGDTLGRLRTLADYRARAGASKSQRLQALLGAGRRGR